jgi:hypothetical protein
MNTSNHEVSNFLFGIGGVLTFLGFIFPGWLWILSTPGDVEMISLALVTLVGVAGFLTMSAGRAKRASEDKKSLETDNE